MNYMRPIRYFKRSPARGLSSDGGLVNFNVDKSLHSLLK